jgi:hypothetical protein
MHPEAIVRQLIRCLSECPSPNVSRLPIAIDLGLVSIGYDGIELTARGALVLSHHERRACDARATAMLPPPYAPEEE